MKRKLSIVSDGPQNLESIIYKSCESSEKIIEAISSMELRDVVSVNRGIITVPGQAIYGNKYN